METNNEEPLEQVMRGRKPRFRFSEHEQKIIDRLQEKGKEFTKGFLAGLVGNIEYVRDNNFVMAVVPTKLGILVGHAKRNPHDAFNLQAGKNIAFKRAISYNPNVEYYIEER